MVSTTEVDNEVEEIQQDIKSCGITIDITEEDDEICEVEHLRKLFIGGLSGETNDVKLRQFYSKWGKVVDSVVMKGPNGRSRGFGFITYTRIAMVDKAQSSRPHIIDGKKVESKRALPRPEQQSATETKKSVSVKKLFVGGLKDNHDEECLKEYFSQFGNVLSVKILIDNTTGKRRGFALIEYDDYDAVDKAILQKTHLIKYVLVDVRKSIYTQEEQKKSIEKDHGRNQENKQGMDQGNRHNFRTRSGQYENNIQQRPYHQRGYQGMNRQTPMPPQPPQQYQQTNPYQQGPPPSYNQWGPPPQYQQAPIPTPTPYAQPPPPPQQYQQSIPPPQQYQQSMPPQNYVGYQQPPMPPAPNPPANWNGYPTRANNWNAPPSQAPPPIPSQPPPSSWQNNQWGGAPPPVAGPPVPMPPGNQPPPNWQQPPPPQNAGPPQHQQPPAMYPQQQQPPPPPPLPNNFGNGYQQNYGGGPAKHQTMYTNRMNPYNAPPNQYNNPPAQGYGNPMSNGNKYRR